MKGVYILVTMISVFIKSVSQLNKMSHKSFSLVFVFPWMGSWKLEKKKLENLKIGAKEKIGSRIVG